MKGPKNAGKSTLARLLFNRLLTRHVTTFSNALSDQSSCSL